MLLLARGASRPAPTPAPAAARPRLHRSRRSLPASSPPISDPATTSRSATRVSSWARTRSWSSTRSRRPEAAERLLAEIRARTPRPIRFAVVDALPPRPHGRQLPSSRRRAPRSWPTRTSAPGRTASCRPDLTPEQRARYAAPAAAGRDLPRPRLPLARRPPRRDLPPARSHGQRLGRRGPGRPRRSSAGDLFSQRTLPGPPVRATPTPGSQTLDGLSADYPDADVRSGPRRGRPRARRAPVPRLPERPAPRGRARASRGQVRRGARRGGPAAARGALRELDRASRHVDGEHRRRGAGAHGHEGVSAGAAP